MACRPAATLLSVRWACEAASGVHRSSAAEKPAKVFLRNDAQVPVLSLCLSSPPQQKKTAHCNTNIRCLLLPLTGNSSGYPASLLWNQLSLWRHSHTLSLLLRLSLKHFFLMKPHQHWYRKRRSRYWKQRHCQVFFRLFVLEPFNSSLCIICDFELQYCYIIKMTT